MATASEIAAAETMAAGIARQLIDDASEATGLACSRSSCCESGGSSVSEDDKTQSSDKHVAVLMHTVHGLLVGFLLCSSVTFCSSNYSRAPSLVDGVLAMSDSVTLDVASAGMVCTGFIVSHMHAHLDADVFAQHVSHALVFMYADVVLAGALSLVLGALWGIDLGFWQHRDAALTILESVSGLRIFDVLHNGWHSLNVTAWPVLCVLWSILLARFPLEGNVYVHRQLGLPALLVLTTLSVGGVLAVCVSAIVHSETDVFYASASSLTYRVQEFNLGILVAFMLSIRQPVALVLRSALAAVFWPVFAMQVLLWWSELGQREPALPGACMRLYPRNDCVPARSAFLFRGSVLALALLARVEIPLGSLPATMTASARDVALLRVLCSAVVFSWPVFMAMHISTHVVFGAGAVHRYAASLSAMLPVVLLGVVAAYDRLVKPHVDRLLLAQVARISALAMHSYESWSERVRARYHAGSHDAPPPPESPVRNPGASSEEP